MRVITFTQSEQEYLMLLLRQRAEVYGLTGNALGSKPKNKYVKAVATVLAKLETNLCVSLRPEEKIICISCINEHIGSYASLLKIPGIATLLCLSQEQIELMHTIDTSKDILHKCGYKGVFDKDPNVDCFRYREVLSGIKTLRNCDLIGLSWDRENEFYKIGFVKEDALYSFELSHSLNLRDLQLHSHLKSGVEAYARQHFTIVTSKKEALSLFNQNNKPQSKCALEFFIPILAHA